jgi:hypothetical protein
MHHIKADIDRLCVKRKEGGRGLLQTEAEKINTAEHLNTKYAEDQFVNVVISHKHTQSNMNSTTKTAVQDVGEFNQSNENGDTKKEDIQHIKARLQQFLKKNRKAKFCMVIILEEGTNSLLAKKAHP